MAANDSEAVAAFFATHEAAIVALTLAVQREIGGHYSALAPARQQEVATANAHDFADAVVTGRVDHAGIAQMLAAHPDPAVVAEIVRMVELQEPHFAQFVATTLADNPPLAQEIQRRARSVATRFRMSLASASLSNLLDRPDGRSPAHAPSRPEEAPH